MRSLAGPSPRPLEMWVRHRISRGIVGPSDHRAVPIIDLTDAEHAAVTAAIRRAVEDDRFPRAPRLDPLRAALARFEAAAQDFVTLTKSPSEPTPHPKAPPAAKAGKRAAITMAGDRWGPEAPDESTA